VVESNDIFLINPRLRCPATRASCFLFTNTTMFFMG